MPGLRGKDAAVNAPLAPAKLGYGLEGQRAAIEHAVDTALPELYAKLHGLPDWERIFRLQSPRDRERIQHQQRERILLLLVPLPDAERIAGAAQLGQGDALLGMDERVVIEAMGLLSSLLHQAWRPLLATNSSLAAVVSHHLAVELRGRLQGLRDSEEHERGIAEQVDLLLIQDLPVEALIPAILAQLVKMSGIHGAWVGAPNDDGLLQPLAVAGRALETYLGRVQIRVDRGPLAAGPMGQAWHVGHSIALDDLTTDTAFLPWRGINDRLAAWRSALAVPILGHDGQPRAVVGVYSLIPGFFASRHRTKILEHLTVMLGLALEKLDAREQLERSTSLYKQFLGEGDLILRARSEEDLLRRTCRRLIDNPWFANAFVLKPDAEGVFWPLAAAGSNSASLQHSRTRPNEDTSTSLVAEAWRLRRLQYHNDYLADARYAEYFPYFRQMGWRSFAVVPVFRQGALWGLLCVAGNGARIFDQTLLAAISQIAKMLGLGLEELDAKAEMEQERAEQSWMARHDALTGLPNRLALLDRLPEALRRGERAERLIAVGMMDLDDFKPVNDRYGHAAGDAVLRMVAQRLQSAMRQTDFVARLGGDEFALVVEDLVSLEVLEGVLERLQVLFTEPFELPDGKAVRVGLSLGLTIFPFDDGDPEQMLRHADHALYVAKSSKGQRLTFYSYFQQMDADSAVAFRHRLALLEQGQLVPCFRPIVGVAGRQVVAVELAARVADEEREMTPEHLFRSIPAPEEGRLTQQLLGQALAALDAAGLFHLDLHVSVSSRFLLRRQTLEDFHQLLQAEHRLARRVTFVVTANDDLLDFALARAQIQELRSAGLRIALNGMGVAHGSLTLLRTMPVDEIQLGRHFVQGLFQRPQDLRVVLHMRELVRSLGARFTVRGVDDAALLDTLCQLRADYLQGRILAPALTATELVPWLRQDPANAQWSQHLQLYASGARHVLAAYAAHLLWDSVYHLAPDLVLQNPRWNDSTQCTFGRFIREQGWEDSDLATAHDVYHRLAAARVSPEELAACQQHFLACMEPLLAQEADASAAVDG